MRFWTLLQSEIARVGLYTPDGLCCAFQQGFLPVPYLWECRDEFARAAAWQTRVVNGGVEVVDEQGAVMPMSERIRRIADAIPPNT